MRPGVAVTIGAAVAASVLAVVYAFRVEWGPLLLWFSVAVACWLAVGWLHDHPEE